MYSRVSCIARAIVLSCRPRLKPEGGGARQCCARMRCAKDLALYKICGTVFFLSGTAGLNTNLRDNPAKSGTVGNYGIIHCTCTCTRCYIFPMQLVDESHAHTRAHTHTSIPPHIYTITFLLKFGANLCSPK